MAQPFNAAQLAQGVDALVKAARGVSLQNVVQQVNSAQSSLTQRGVPSQYIQETTTRIRTKITETIQANAQLPPQQIAMRTMEALNSEISTIADEAKAKLLNNKALTEDIVNSVILLFIWVCVHKAVILLLVGATAVITTMAAGRESGIGILIGLLPALSLMLLMPIMRAQLTKIAIAKDITWTTTVIGHFASDSLVLSFSSVIITYIQKKIADAGRPQLATLVATLLFMARGGLKLLSGAAEGLSKIQQVKAQARSEN